MSNEKYIEELEDINEMLREKIREYERILENTWQESKTLGLIPDKDFYYADNPRIVHGIKLKHRVWSSLLGLREFIINHNKKENSKLYIYPDKNNGTLWTTFTDDVNEYNVKSKYRVCFCSIENTRNALGTL
jgi:hypothetical protein